MPDHCGTNRKCQGASVSISLQFQTSRETQREDYLHQKRKWNWTGIYDFPHHNTFQEIVSFLSQKTGLRKFWELA
ncbi:hypothetical protein D3C87_1393810 [compost metagenome]